jgi:hypothetical protein
MCLALKLLRIGDPIMDAVFIAISVAFFALTWGFVVLCEKV